MDLSGFNVYLADFPSRGETLVYNTFSGGSAVLASDDVERFRQGAFAGADPDLADPDVGIVVESRAAEERDFHAWLRRVKSDASTLDALISTSYACNLACTYCYQEEVMNGKTMSPATADATVAFLAERARALRPEQVELMFIGGEPLLHPHLIERIAGGLRPVCDEIGASLRFQITTNGTLMTPEVIGRLVALGLQQVHVTIDGDECSHGITRRDKRGRNTFQQTWQNVLACLPLVKIGIQGNYSEDNLHGFLPLLERMKRDGVDPERIPRVRFKPALGAIGTAEDAGIDACSWSSGRPEVQVALADAVRAFGYTPHDQLALGPCSLHYLNHFTIGPDGLVFKCPGFLGKQEWATGDVSTGLTPRHRQLTTLANTRECGSCSYRPACAGACLAIPWVAAGSPDGVNCERSYLDSVGPEVIKRNYLLENLERDQALAAIAEMPGRFELPNGLKSAPPPPMRPAERLIQIRAPRRAA